MSFSNYLENAVLDHVMGESAYSMPTTYLALCTSDPGEAGTGSSMNETPNSGNYSRVAVSGNLSPATNGTITNDVLIAFPQANANWSSDITHFAVVDSGTYGSGNMLMSGALTQSKTVTSGDTVQFAIGDLDITLD